MSSCMANVPAAFQDGGVCASRGVCVNSALNPGLMLCKCDAWYSGASDLFDSRVEQMYDGTWLSLSCNSSLIGTYVVWGLFCIFGLIRLKQLVPVWINFYKRHYEDPQKAADGVWNDASLRVLSLDVSVAIPFFITGFCKLAGMTLGTDALPTVTFCLIIILFQLSVFDLTKTEFDIFVQGAQNPMEAGKAKQLRLVMKCFSFACFIGFGIIPVLWSISLDKSLGPIQNKEELVIYIRNSGVLVYGLAEIVTTHMIRSRVRKILSFTKSGEDSAVTKVIVKMDAEMKQYIIFMGTIGLVYAIHMIPYVHPHQTYIIAILGGIGAMRHSAKAFTQKQTQESKASKEPTSTSKGSTEGRKSDSANPASKGRGSIKLARGGLAVPENPVRLSSSIVVPPTEEPASFASSFELEVLPEPISQTEVIVTPPE